MLPLSLLCSLAGLALFGGPVFDRVTPVLFWSWLAGAPLLGTAALVASRRRGRRARAILNGVLLGAWAVLAAGALLLH